MNKTADICPETFGVSSMVAPLRKVAMRAPGKAMLNAKPEEWHYGKVLVPEELCVQYQDFVHLIEQSGSEICWIEAADDGLADSTFTYDPSFVTPAGAIIMSPGKMLRMEEAKLHASFYHRLGIPVIGEIAAPARLEGGDCFWLDETTIAVGRGFRTNQAGVVQLSNILEHQGIEVLSFDLPVYQGKEACLHLMSVVSLLAEKLALVYAPLMPVTLYQAMLELGFVLLEAPVHEFEGSGGLNLNVLATAPKQCIAVDGFPVTHALMREAGCEVATFAGDELCIPCEGGPTCMTRPILRA